MCAGFGEPVGQRRRREQARQVVAHRARGRDRRQVGGPLRPPLAGHRAGDRHQRQRAGDQREGAAERQRQRLRLTLGAARTLQAQPPVAQAGCGSAAHRRRDGRRREPAGRRSSERPPQHRGPSPALGRSPTASAHSARSRPRSARSTAPAGRIGAPSASCSRRAARLTATMPLAADRERRPHPPSPLSSGAGSGGRSCRRGDAGLGKCAASRSSSPRARRVAISDGRGGRPGSRSTSSPAPVGFRPRAGQRRGCGPGAARRADPSDKENRAHPGLADADEERTRRPSRSPKGEGGLRRTVTRPRSTSTSTSSSAQPGRPPRAPWAAERPRQGRGRRPRRHRRPGSARNQRAVAAGRSGRRAATPAPRRRARPRPGRARYPPGPTSACSRRR